MDYGVLMALDAAEQAAENRSQHQGDSGDRDGGERYPQEESVGLP